MITTYRCVRTLYLILLYSDDSFSDELVRKLLQDPLLLFDLLVHQGLGEHGLIHLIMAVASVAHLKVKMKKFQHDQAPVCREMTIRWSETKTYQVHNHIFVECVPPFSCHLTHVHHSLCVVCVDVEDGSVDNTGDICGVRR